MMKYPGIFLQAKCISYCCLLVWMILLTGCVLSHHDATEQQNWRGKSVDALMEARGLPDEMIQTGHGSTLYIYRFINPLKTQSQTSPMGVNVSRSGRVVIVPPSSSYNMPANTVLPIWCAMVFEITGKGVIVNMRVEGNHCNRV